MMPKFRDILLSVWDDMVSNPYNPDKSGLADLIVKNVQEKHPDVRADWLRLADEFVGGRLSLKLPHQRVIANKSYVDPWHRGPYTSKKPRWFEFQGKRYNVDCWKDLLVKLCELVAMDNPGEFHRATCIYGEARERSYFVASSPRSRGQLTHPRRVGDTGLSVETNLSANNTYDLCVTLLKHFGYDSDGKEVFTTSVDEELNRRID
jgi:hypothetical protein